jgi:hypothetical protein
MLLFESVLAMLVFLSGAYAIVALARTKMFDKPTWPFKR